MSSAEEESGSSKKRKLQRACDYCRRKKIKCDGPENPSGCCSRCAARRAECTYFDAMQRTMYPASYVESLEQRLERVEKLLEEMRPEGHNAATDPDTESIVSESSRACSALRELARTATPAGTNVGTNVQDPINVIDSEASDTANRDISVQFNDDGEGLAEGFRQLTVDFPSYRYHGKYSALVLIHAISDLRSRTLGSKYVDSESRPPEYKPSSKPWLKCMLEYKMSAFQEFPPPDLLYALVELYFRRMNDHNPLLHEPTFRKSVDRGLHLHHGDFGATVLLVCANGARFSNDPRVQLDDQGQQSAGWKWFKQVEEARRLQFAPAKLYDLQSYALMILFLQGSAASVASWTLIGTAIRAAVDVGAHRKHMYSATPTVEGELWKRAFWILVTLDWLMAYGVGRMPCIHEEDIDVGLLTECDDEYWTTSEGKLSFEQPPDKPSKITAFNCLIRLTKILAYAHQTLHSLSISGTPDQTWESRVVTELDSALNNWVTSLPEHLHWDPDRENALFLTQSAILYAYYYQYQIAVHRPFVSPRTGAPASFPSLIICTNAARSCVHVTHVVYTRTGDPHWQNMGMVLLSSLILMLNIWTERRSGRAISGIARDVALVQKCVDMLRTLQPEMPTVETVTNILEGLMENANSPASPSAQEGSQNPRATATGLTPPPAEVSMLSGPSQTSSHFPRQSTSIVPPSPLLPSTTELPQMSQQGAEIPNLYTPQDPLTASTQHLTFENLVTREAEGQLPSILIPGADPGSLPASDLEGEQGMSVDGILPDFAFVDDMMSMWSTGAPTFGTIDWDTIFSNVDNHPNA